MFGPRGQAIHLPDNFYELDLKNSEGLKPPKEIVSSNVKNVVNSVIEVFKIDKY